ncbi:hypothetical protein GCM10009765_48300 [Fodinicola feengrottensis]|uniref:Uncharacterized protein n=1 Tax=Fodinicola feengrottensis TaxID=435914 RepID=A0ABP4TTC2_9ACTN
MVAAACAALLLVFATVTVLRSAPSSGSSQGYCATPSQMNFYPGIKTGQVRYGDVSIAITACKNAWVSSWLVDAFPITNAVGLTARHEVLTQRINGPIDENGRSITIRILIKFCPGGQVCNYGGIWDVGYVFSRDTDQNVLVSDTVTRVDDGKLGYELYTTPKQQ